MTVDFALHLASAAARVLAPDGGRVLIGKDTRVSGYMFESALEAGFVAAGVDVMLIGPLPTPGIAYMTQRLGCSFGVVISASHNRYEDNGIKFFDGAGSKLSDELESRIEALLESSVLTRESQRLGKATRMDKTRTQYQEFCASTIPAGMTLEGFKIVVDCANGAGYKVGPRLLADLGADLGRCVEGDQLLYVLARARRDAGLLRGPVVGTVMSNLGLEHALAEAGIEFRRAQVGDRYVLAMLQEVGGTLGGETSGHILCLDKTTTGDGLISALQVLAVMKSTGASLAELCAPMPKYPQVLLNVRVAQRFDPMSHPRIREVVESVKRRFDGRGRTVLRASGTEPVIRVMVEGQDAKLVKAAARDIAAAVEAAAVPPPVASAPSAAPGLAVGGPRG